MHARCNANQMVDQALPSCTVLGRKSVHMILRIRTPEDVFRSENCDVYILDFREQDPHKKKKTWAEIEKWLRQNLPESAIEILGPSENSNYIEGGPLTMRVCFTQSDLRTFCRRWEDAEGRSVDPRFQCILLSYEEWKQKHRKPARVTHDF